MKSYLLASGIFGAALAGTVILPSLFGLFGNIAVPVFLIVFMLYRRNGLSDAVAGTVFAFAAELFLGIHPGVMAAAFLVTLLCLLALDRFVQLRPLASETSLSPGSAVALASLSVILFAVFSLSFVLAERVLYRLPAAPKAVFMTHPVYVLADAAVTAGVIAGIFMLAGRIPGLRPGTRDRF